MGFCICCTPKIPWSSNSHFPDQAADALLIQDPSAQRKLKTLEMGCAAFVNDIGSPEKAGRLPAGQNPKRRGSDGSDGDDTRSMEAVSGFTSPGGPAYDLVGLAATVPSAI